MTRKNKTNKTIATIKHEGALPEGHPDNCTVQHTG